MKGVQNTQLPDHASIERLLSSACNHDEADHRSATERDQQDEAEKQRTDISEPRLDYAALLSEIVELQRSIQSNHLELPEAMTLIARRAQELTHACGAAVAFLEGSQLVYTAAAGDAESLAGSRISLEGSFSAPSVRERKVVQSADFHADPRIAAPLYRGEEVVGVLELRFPSPKFFQPDDLRVCQIMAGFLAEALHRAEELERKRLPSECAIAMQELEKLQPQLERLAAQTEAQESSANTLPRTESLLSDSIAASSRILPDNCQDESVSGSYMTQPFLSTGRAAEEKQFEREDWQNETETTQTPRDEQLLSAFDEIAARFAAEDSKFEGAVPAFDGTELVPPRCRPNVGSFTGCGIKWYQAHS